MIAGINILYEPGTTVMPGGYMLGKITTNGQYCGQQLPALPSVATGGEEPAMVPVTTSFSVYPNPTSGKFTIELKGEKVYGKVQVEVYGMQGERLMSGEFTGELQRINDPSRGAVQLIDAVRPVSQAV